MQAGNNEDYQVAESLKLELDYSDENPENFRKTNFPAFALLLHPHSQEHHLTFYFFLYPSVDTSTRRPSRTPSTPSLRSFITEDLLTEERTRPIEPSEIFTNGTSGMELRNLGRNGISFQVDSFPSLGWKVSRFNASGLVPFSLVGADFSLLRIITQASPTSERSTGSLTETRRSDSLNLVQ